MFRSERFRFGAVLAVAAVLTFTLAAPAAAGPAGWGEARDLAAGLWPRLLAWLGLGPVGSAAPKCEHGAMIDPNGCPKHGSQIDPNGNPGTEAAGADTEHGAMIDPDGHT